MFWYILHMTFTGKTNLDLNIHSTDWINTFYTHVVCNFATEKTKLYLHMHIQIIDNTFLPILSNFARKQSISTTILNMQIKYITFTGKLILICIFKVLIKSTRFILFFVCNFVRKQTIDNDFARFYLSIYLLTKYFTGAFTPWIAH